MTNEEFLELSFLDAQERTGAVLTGKEKGRLWDLRKAELIESFRGPVVEEKETR